VLYTKQVVTGCFNEIQHSLASPYQTQQTAGDRNLYIHRGRSRVWKGEVHFVEKVEDQKKRRSRMSEGSSNITMKLKYIIIIPFIVSQINYTA